MSRAQREHRKLMREQAKDYRWCKDHGMWHTAWLHLQLAKIHRWQSEEAP